MGSPAASQPGWSSSLQAGPATPASQQCSLAHPPFHAGACAGPTCSDPNPCSSSSSLARSSHSKSRGQGHTWPPWPPRPSLPPIKGQPRASLGFLLLPSFPSAPPPRVRGTHALLPRSVSSLQPPWPARARAPRRRRCDAGLPSVDPEHRSAARDPF